MKIRKSALLFGGMLVAVIATALLVRHPYFLYLVASEDSGVQIEQTNDPDLLLKIAKSSIFPRVRRRQALHELIERAKYDDFCLPNQDIDDLSSRFPSEPGELFNVFLRPITGDVLNPRLVAIVLDAANRDKERASAYLKMATVESLSSNQTDMLLDILSSIEPVSVRSRIQERLQRLNRTRRGQEPK